MLGTETFHPPTFDIGGLKPPVPTHMVLLWRLFFAVFKFRCFCLRDVIFVCMHCVCLKLSMDNVDCIMQYMKCFPLMIITFIFLMCMIINYINKMVSKTYSVIVF